MIELNTLVRENIKALKSYSSARDEFSGSEGIFLDANENPFGELQNPPWPINKTTCTITNGLSDEWKRLRVAN